MKTLLMKRDKSKYYRFYQNYGYDTKDYYDLKEQIEELIYSKHLVWFIYKHWELSPRPQGLMEKQIDIIIDGPTSRRGWGWVDISLVYKAYIQATIEKRLKMEGNMKITFKWEEVECLNPNHIDALVVSVRMINTWVRGSWLTQIALLRSFTLMIFENLRC